MNFGATSILDQPYLDDDEDSQDSSDDDDTLQDNSDDDFEQKYVQVKGLDTSRLLVKALDG